MNPAVFLEKRARALMKRRVGREKEEVHMV